MLSKSAGEKKPLVSIIVPVYNSEKYLRKCMDSLVNQTLQSIEIIVVNDGSTDGSLAILEDYRERFPNKVVIRSIGHIHGAGAPRNIAIKMARGDYLGFCDSDDVMDTQAAELLYKKAIDGDNDIVCAPLWLITKNSKVLYGKMEEPISTEKLILNGQVYLPNKLIHKRLLNKVGDIPENISTEDLGYSLVLHSYARKIGYIDHPVYFYYKRYGSDSNSVFELRNLDTIKARQYALNNCNPQYRQYVATYVARHINSDIRKRWIFTDRFIQQLKELWPELRNNRVLKSDEYLYNRLQRFAYLPDKPIPRNLFIGGFGGAISDDVMREYQEKAFYDGCNLLVLNELNCDVTEREIVENAYNAGEFDFVNGYFALKAISIQGGIYLDRRIIIDAPFNYVRYCKAFFSLIDDQAYSNWVFGGMPQNETILKILETYLNSNLYDDPLYPLNDRIRDVLEDYNISLTEVNNLIDYPYTVFSPDVMVCDTTDKLSLRSELHICSHNLTNHAGESEYITIKRSTLRALINIPGSNDELNEVKRENAMLRNKVRDMELVQQKEKKK